MVFFLFTFAVEQELCLFPGRSKDLVTLPFKYHHEKLPKQLAYVPQLGYTYLNKGDQCLVGPLQPCFGIMLADNEKAIVFHLHYLNSRTDMLRKCQTYFSESNPRNISGTIFTNIINEQFYKSNITDPEQTGRNQIEELKFVKDTLIDGLKIPDRKQIRACHFKTPYADYELGNYEFAELFLHVAFNRHAVLQISSICPMQRCFFPGLAQLDLHARGEATRMSLAQFDSQPFLGSDNSPDRIGCSSQRMNKRYNTLPCFPVNHMLNLTHLQ